MRLPRLEGFKRKTKSYIINFGGINRSASYREGELEHSEGLSSDMMPYLTQEGTRENGGTFSFPNGIFAHDGIALVAGNRFLYKSNNDEEFAEKMELSDSKKIIAQLGKSILVFPDGVIFDTEKDKWSKMNLTLPLAPKGVSKKNSREDVWHTTVEHNRIKTSDVRSDMDTTAKEGDYLTDILASVEVGDIITVEVDGVFNYESDSAASKLHKFENIKVTGKNDSGLIFEDNTFFEEKTQTTYIEVKSGKISKEGVEMEYICEHGGRIWGCKGNTIYASEYNNPRNFNCFEGLSSDSYAIDVTTPGEFTGCAAYSSHIIFFKENYIHKIYGTRPSNFSMVVSSAPGVEKGSHASVGIINERLFYKGADGIYMYSGGVPSLVSACLGTEKYTDGVAGCFRDKYYISMKNTLGEYDLFCLDTRNGIMLRIDNTQLTGTANYDGKLLLLESNGALNMISDSADVANTEWIAQFRSFNETVNEKKGYSNITMRVELSDDAYMDVELKFDDGRWEHFKTVNRPGEQIVFIPIQPNRCDSFGIRLSGRGECRIKNMVREFSVGSGVR